MVTFMLMVTCTPFNQVGLGWLDWNLDHSWGQLGSIPGDQVAPQIYGGPTIALDHVIGGQKLLVDLW